MNCKRCKISFENYAEIEHLLCKSCMFDASYNHLLRTNTMPSSIERKLINAQIIRNQQAIASVARQITLHSDDSGELQAERTFLLKRHQLYQSIVSIVRRLPDEIWLEIFTNFIFDDPIPPSRSQEYEEKKAKKILIRVCSKWRDYIMANPKFWNRITISNNDKLCIEEKFSQTGPTIPISLSIGFSSADDAEMSFNGWMEQYIPRLNTLEIRCEIPKLPWLNTFPILHSLTFHHVRDRVTGMWLGPEGPQHGACLITPNLRDATFNFVDNPLGAPIQWTTLSTLTLRRVSGISIRPVMQILASTSASLQHFKLSLEPERQSRIYSEHGPHPHFSAFLPKLIRLDVCLHHAEETKRLIDSLTTPSLNTLALGPISFAMFHETAVSLVNRSSCSLTEIGLRDVCTHHAPAQPHQTINTVAIARAQSIVAVLTDFPAVPTIRVDGDIQGQYANAIVGMLGANAFPAPSHLKVIYQHPAPQNVQIGRLNYFKGLGIILARASQPIVNIQKVEDAQYFDRNPGLFEANDAKRIDIYL